MNTNCERQIDAAASVSNEVEIASCENIVSHAQESAVIAKVVSPAISPAVSPASNREQLIIEVQGSQSGNQSGIRNEKPNCYECKYRAALTYSSHSECKHPALDGKARVLAVAWMFAGKPFQYLGVKGSRHGIENGWFFWPLDFDPVWLERCEGFEPKEAA